MRLLLVLVVFAVTACKSNPHKAEKIDTQLDKSARISGDELVGLKKGEMVVMSKEDMSEKLRDLQNTVFSLEDKVYGNRKFKSLGLYGDLKSCKRKLASRQYGGSGTLVWSEPLDRVTDKEQELQVGLDEKKDLVGVSEEYLKDRIARFQGYKLILQKRSDEFESQIESCKSELANKEMDENQPSKVMVQEVAKASFDKSTINQFMCAYVKSGASLQNFLLNAFAKGWLALGDYRLEQNLVQGSLRDVKGSTKDNALLFNGWKLSFDRGPVTVGEVLNLGKDAQLVAWAYERKTEVPEAQRCLASNDGQWNP